MLIELLNDDTKISKEGRKVGYRRHRRKRLRDKKQRDDFVTRAAKRKVACLASNSRGCMKRAGKRKIG